MIDNKPQDFAAHIVALCSSLELLFLRRCPSLGEFESLYLEFVSASSDPAYRNAAPEIQSNIGGAKDVLILKMASLITLGSMQCEGTS